MPGYLSEIFASIQGEGELAGSYRLFLRLAGCNLNCNYCDTTYARTKGQRFNVYKEESSSEIDNPVEAGRVLEIITEDFPRLSRVVITGGEPLLQPEFLMELLPNLKAMGYEISLETNGTLVESLRQVKPWIDFVSVDFKLPSTQNGVDLSNKHVEFLREVCGRKFAVKVIVTAASSGTEIEKAFRLLGTLSRQTRVYIQPAVIRGSLDVDASRLIEYQKKGLKYLSDVRISLQIHKILGVR